LGRKANKIMFMKKPLLFPFKKESFVDSDRRFTYLFQSHLKHLVICMLLLLGSILQGYSQNFTNGSFTGTKGDNVAAPGWTIIPPTFGTSNTPDINDAIGSSVFTTGGYNWTGGTPVASPDGGTWQNLFSTEKITQTVTGLTIGKTYSFSYYYTTQGIVGFPASLTTYVTPMLPDVTITGATGYTNPTSVGTLFQWQLHTSVITATATSATFTFFGPAASGYLAYDGASLVSSCNAGTTAPTLSATTKSNVCPTTMADISSLVSSTCPSGSSLEWHTVSTGLSASNKVANPMTVGAGTYYPVCYDATAACYSPTPATGVTVTITTCASPLAITQPSAITKAPSVLVSGTAPTDLIPTGGTGTITYSNGSGDILCVAPIGAMALSATSNLTVSATGAYSYTTPTTPGTYYFCVKVCDSSSPTAQCQIASYKVIVTGAGCAVGSAIPGVN
jgi:hypothetical protein